MTNKTNTCERCGAWVPDDATGCHACGLSWTKGVKMGIRFSPGDVSEETVRCAEARGVTFIELYDIITTYERDILPGIRRGCGGADDSHNIVDGAVCNEFGWRVWDDWRGFTEA